MQPAGWRPPARLAARETLALLRVYKLAGRPVKQPPASRTVPVLLVPGFMAGDWSLVPMARWLRQRGYRTYPAGVRMNADCTTVLVERLERLLVGIAEQAGPVAIVGHSRGGTLAKLVAVRRPELVRGIVTLAAPNINPLAASTAVLNQVELLLRLNRRGLRGLLTEDCVRGECAERTAAHLNGPFPRHIAYTSVYSRTDGIVEWQACLDPHAEHVEVTTTHNGMGSNAGVYRIVERRLRPLESRQR